MPALLRRVRDADDNVSGEFLPLYLKKYIQRAIISFPHECRRMADPWFYSRSSGRQHSIDSTVWYCPGLAPGEAQLAGQIDRGNTRDIASGDAAGGTGLILLKLLGRRGMIGSFLH